MRWEPNFWVFTWPSNVRNTGSSWPKWESRTGVGNGLPDIARPTPGRRGDHRRGIHRRRHGGRTGGARPEGRHCRKPQDWLGRHWAQRRTSDR
uniref:Uncharacterized protein n=1 Tax=Tanacetum cinerariifolium TaxID=118510 RepID=A0A699WJT0_TANCI|nr:hypothetical protein [Tanacetum cinerariifolium]